jgi:sensor histidine kinase YesM
MTSEAEGNTTGAAVRLNDRTIRLVGIPFFGICIPLVTGLFGSLNYTDFRYWAGFLYFIALSAMIWEGNRYLLFRTRKRFTWFDKPSEKLVLLLINNIFYTTPLTIAWLCVWYRLAGFTETHWEVVQLVTLMNVICVLFITHVYETVFIVKEHQGEQLKNAQLSQAKAVAELDALKNQLDPHFMFNSLNSLSYLIETDPEKAKLFTENLAGVYRYILAQKDYNLVTLDDEFSFVGKYAALLRLRFGAAIEIRKDFNGTTGQEFLLPPVSAFVALENAVKHNEVSEKFPLHLELSLHGACLVIKNRIRQKRSIRASTGIGLKNLNERFRILTGQPIRTSREDGYFIIYLPLMPIQS